MNDTRTPLPKNEMRKILRLLKSREAEMVRTLGLFVRCESPSHDKRAVDRFGEIVAAQWRERDAKVRVLAVAKRGNQVRAEIDDLGSGTRTKQQIMILGHLDTVYPLGTLAKTPFRISGGRAWGPGTFDMKGGLVLALFALDALKAAGIEPAKRLVFLWTSDEEIGSESSRQAIETEALRSDAVLVLEPSFGRDGRLKTARKGVGSAQITVTGRSAHAGVDPEKGVNAVQELALQIERLMKVSNRGLGIAVQTTVVSGGTVSNVIPEHAHAEVDIRFSRAADGPRLNRKLRSFGPISKGARVEIRGGTNRPPLERTAAVRALFRHAQSLMRDMGLPLGEAATGGGSDGNLTGALGVPTLDGLGAVGDFPHSPREHIIIRALPERAALLAGLLATL
ncbi:MAG TPA: M20 family metallopeptidase [Candidatus Binatus sp.]|jgi:glutamate carboxypeptidase|nr:M20 family metallopeptidase [Candidatus Binatus sp.]